jgi:hypothetical protein
MTSVAPLFVSYWDLDQLTDERKDELGIAVSKRTYRRFRELFGSAPWRSLLLAAVLTTEARG